MWFALGFYEAFLWLLNPVDKEVWCLDLNFHLERFEFMMILSSMFTKRFIAAERGRYGLSFMWKTVKWAYLVHSKHIYHCKKIVCWFNPHKYHLNCTKDSSWCRQWSTSFCHGLGLHLFPGQTGFLAKLELGYKWNSFCNWHILAKNGMELWPYSCIIKWTLKIFIHYSEALGYVYVLAVSIDTDFRWQ